mmetsp:Transcript_19417/g.17211  ORF Transcript_19417/g.17211 Transcript_19417/m.17211 type:complete len:176 (+) Transcript_19417:132-659(+)
MAIVTDDPVKMNQYVEGLEDLAGEVSLLEGNIIDSDNEHVDRLAREPAKVLGVLTLEDLIEYIMKEEILDEADYDNDLANKMNPNVRADRSWANESNNLSTIFMENRGKIQDFIQSHMRESMEESHKKFKFRKDYTGSITLDKKDLTTPLIDSKNNVKDDQKIEDKKEDNKEDNA